MTEVDFNELQELAIKFGEVTKKSATYLEEVVSIMKKGVK